VSWLPKFFQRRTLHASGLAQYHPAVFYPVGSENQVYEPAAPVFPAMLPPVNLIGNAILSNHTPNPLQLPQLYANQTAFVAGVAGPLAGQMVTGPLNIPETTNGSQ
jgi:hypothetical protein